MALRVPCAGAVIFESASGAGRLLLIRRGRPPAAGTWSLPGGKCLPGEEPAAARVREVAEETGLRVRVVRPAGRVEREGPADSVYVIDDFVCALEGGHLVAGDDAIGARWADLATLARLDLSPGLFEALAEWGLLPD